jgi:hypothetical protein
MEARAMTESRLRKQVRAWFGAPAQSVGHTLGGVGLGLAAAWLLACGSAGAACPTPFPTQAAVATDVPAATETEPPTATLAPAIDACALVPKAEAELVAGTPLEAGVPGNPLNPSCTYTGPVTGPLGQVSVYVGPSAKKTYDIDVELKHTFAPVAGIGDEAYEEPFAIFFREGETWVAIELVRLNDAAANRIPLEDAAKKAVARLP